MIDTRATHNYLVSTEVERLGLVLEKGVGQVKAINSAAQPIAGLAKSVLIKVGHFKDLKSGYWQDRIKEGDKVKTKVVTKGTLAEHVEHLRQVLTRLHEHDLYEKVSKCSFAQETINFLGHIVERGRIRMDPKKV
ncbi:UNVERIFIED_CONTAM: hypothetical protein Scaly_0068500 [Sesamum calycinum]|uniref:Uncharacterized protein n=1 Tax=Sesamum calycinum TaxID=2727403 RepID=A0AAW2SUC4_9LAMI